jgi:hypothetical protein
MSKIGKIGSQQKPSDERGRKKTISVKGLRAALFALQGEDKKDVFASKLKIPLRTLNEVERRSAISFTNLLKLKHALAPGDFENIAALCPPGVLDEASQKLVHRRWRFHRWEVDIRIENDAGDAEYQTNVCIENSTNQIQTLSPAHSVLATVDSGVCLRDIRAYDVEGPLIIEDRVSVQTPTYLRFQVKSRRPVPPNQIWRYWWEVSWPKGFKDLRKGDIFTYQGDTLVEEVLVKIVIPKTMKSAGDPTMVSNSGESPILRWTKIHGRDAVVLHRMDVPSDEIWNVRFGAKES